MRREAEERAVTGPTTRAFTSRCRSLGVMIAALAVTAAACGGDSTEGTSPTGQPTANLSGMIRIDGSSTVAPLSEAAAELFQAQHRNVQVTVGTSGTGGGFEKF